MKSLTNQTDSTPNINVICRTLKFAYVVKDIGGNTLTDRSVCAIQLDTLPCASTYILPSKFLTVTKHMSLTQNPSHLKIRFPIETDMKLKYSEFLKSFLPWLPVKPNLIQYWPAKTFVVFLKDILAAFINFLSLFRCSSDKKSISA